MIIKNNVSLKNLTTLKVGGVCKRLYIPESENELIELVQNDKGKYLISGGSNILINDRKMFEDVVSLKQFNKKMEYIGHNCFYVGASVSISSFIKYAQSFSCGGLELLFGIPCLIGGALVSNCGYGKDYNLSIGAYVKYVNVYVDGKILELSNKDCNFSYRDSIFKHKNYIILSAIIKLEYKDLNDIEDGIKKRILFNKEFLEQTPYSLGSVYSECNPRIMTIMHKLNKRNKKGCFFSRSNMIGHNGNGKYVQYYRLIKLTTFLHRLFLKKVKIEIVIWK